MSHRTRIHRTQRDEEEDQVIESTPNPPALSRGRTRRVTTTTRPSSSSIVPPPPLPPRGSDLITLPHMPGVTFAVNQNLMETNSMELLSTLLDQPVNTRVQEAERRRIATAEYLSRERITATMPAVVRTTDPVGVLRERIYLMENSTSGDEDHEPEEPVEMSGDPVELDSPPVFINLSVLNKQTMIRQKAYKIEYRKRKADAISAAESDSVQRSSALGEENDKLIDQLIEAVTCVCCYDRVSDFLLIECGHMMCGVCIINMNDLSEKTTFDCPMCSLPVRTTPFSVCNIKKIYPLDGLRLPCPLKK